MRKIAIFTLLLLSATVARPQKDQFLLTAKVTASDTESVPSGASTSTTTAMPGTIWQHPQQHTKIKYHDVFTVTAEIENRVYRLQSSRLLDPGNYPASIEKHTVRLLLKDKNGNTKTVNLRILSVAAE
jgi:hypothetical protein